MKLRIEISLHPLTENFIPPIDDFIYRLNEFASVEVTTNELSTFIVGEYDDVMRILSSEMKKSFEEKHKAVFVAKFHTPS